MSRLLSATIYERDRRVLARRAVVICWALCLAGGGVAAPTDAVAAASQKTSACVPANDPPDSDTDTEWSVRSCGVPDYDQQRTPAENLGGPAPLTTLGLPGGGACHCALAAIANIYGQDQEPLKDTGGFSTFDWGSRGTLAAAPADGTEYDTSTYTDEERAAYAGTTSVLQSFGDVANVQYGQTKGQENSCGTTYGALTANLGTLVARFGRRVGDYTFNDVAVKENSAADMANALFAGNGVALTYGYYSNNKIGLDGDDDTATERVAGHATTLVGVTRSDNVYSFELSDPAESAEVGTPDPVRQSKFARTTWRATERRLKVTTPNKDPKLKPTVSTSTRYKLDGANRYIETWMQVVSPPAVAVLGKRPRTVLLKNPVPVKDLTRRLDLPQPRPTVTFPGPVNDVVYDLTRNRLDALVPRGRKVVLYEADPFTGKLDPVTASLPPGADRLTTLADGQVAVVGSGAVQVLDRAGKSVAKRKVAGGAADVAFDPTTSGIVVLRADGKRALKFSPSLAPLGGRSVTLPKASGVPASMARISVDAEGKTRVSRAAPGSGKLAVATAAGGEFILQNGKATLRTENGGKVPDRTITGLSGATIFDLATGVSLIRAPAGLPQSTLIDGPLDPPVPGYEEFSRVPSTPKVPAGGDDGGGGDIGEVP